MAEEMQIPFLGRIPLDQKVAQCCDEGQNFFEIHPNSLPALAYIQLANGNFSLTFILNNLIHLNNKNIIN